MVNHDVLDAVGVHVLSQRQWDPAGATAGVQLGAGHRAGAVESPGRATGGASWVGCTVEAI